MSITPKADKPADEDLSFSLAGMAELATKSGIDVGESPERDAAESAEEADEAAKRALEVDDADLPENKTDEEIAAEKAEADRLAAEAAEGQTDEEKAAAEAAKAEADAKKAEEDAAKAQADARAAELASGRDADINKVIEEAKQTSRPKTVKNMEVMRSAVQKARDEAEAARKEADAAKLALEEAKKAVSSTAIPKEVEEERAALRERVRELDAERDPEIVKKYDSKIKANDEGAIALLKELGYDKATDENGKVVGDNPNAIPDLLAKGINFRSLGAVIAKLDKLGRYEDSEALKAFIRDNQQLRQARAAEVQTIKADVDTRVKARSQQAEQAQAATTKRVIEFAGRFLQEDLGKIAKKHTFLAKPEAPKPTDTPAVAASKKAALTEWENTEAEVGKVAKAINSTGKAGDEYVTAEANKASLAIQSVVLTQRVIPRLEKDLASSQARVKELEAEVAKFKGAGAISRAHGAAAKGNGKAVDSNPNESTEDAMTKFAKSQGIAV